MLTTTGMHIISLMLEGCIQACMAYTIAYDDANTDVADPWLRDHLAATHMNRSVVRIPGPNDPSLEDMRQHQDEHTALRLAWLIFAGWWLSAIWLILAWFCILLVVSRPLGMRMIANLTLVATLEPPGDTSYDIAMDTLGRIEDNNFRQRRFILRLLYCAVIGWWLSIAWAILAWTRSLSAQQQPETMSMLMKLPAVMTLQRY